MFLFLNTPPRATAPPYLLAGSFSLRAACSWFLSSASCLCLPPLTGRWQRGDIWHPTLSTSPGARDRVMANRGQPGRLHACPFPQLRPCHFSPYSSPTASLKKRWKVLTPTQSGVNTIFFSPLQGKCPSASNLSETKLSCQGTQRVFERTLLICQTLIPLITALAPPPPISVLSLSRSGSPLWDLDGPFPQLSGPPMPPPLPIPETSQTTLPPLPLSLGPLGNLPEGVAMETS